ncbi:MAG: FeoB small GTPase domain-containing protein, partial [Pseudomonadales bacterium]|nr:FeoB small GTPase domain-containing protein [Pseudomonadales bacterium]
MNNCVVALIGNPNSGKTTLFNDLTGAHQKVGNWPGVTVEQKTGTFMLDATQVQLVDLPGIYSLEQDYLGIDERIAKDFISGSEVDFVINIVDASNLERNLVLTQQLLERNHNVIVALNMLDVAQQQGIELDAVQLSRNLDVPVAPLVASTGEGIEDFRELLAFKLSETPQDVEVLPSDSDAATTAEKLIRRYHRAQALVDGVMEVTPIKHSLTASIDRWVLNRWLGIPFFLLMMYLMFTIAVNVGAVFIDFFDILFGAIFVDGFRWLLEEVSTPQWIIVLLTDGLGGGIQLVATFIPVIGFLFLCLSILEDSGYMSRA